VGAAGARVGVRVIVLACVVYCLLLVAVMVGGARIAYWLNNR
jgi:hypothetical protein